MSVGDLPDYNRLKLYISARYKMQNTDPNFEDKYHDTWVQFLTHWNGEGNPYGAFSLMFSQWYTKRAERRRVSLWVSIYRDRGMDVPDDDALDPWDQYLEHCMMYSTNKMSLMQSIRKAELSTSQLDLLLLTLLGYSLEEIGDLLSVSRQAVDSRYKKVLQKILKKVQ